MNAAMVSFSMAECLPMCINFLHFDATDFKELSDEMLEILNAFASQVVVFKLKGNKLCLW